jgi:serine/threonine protein kinase/tetratricopeptide (TPR) repeat protein
MPEIDFVPDGYKILRHLGTGGTARVFLARRIQDSKICALKTPLSDDPGDRDIFRKLIERESQLIGGHIYPGLVRVIGIDARCQNYPFLLLEYCPYGTLDRIDRSDSIDQLLNLISSISINLYYLRLAGLSHGDFKPQNIYFCAPMRAYSRHDFIYSKISDFSLALKEGENYRERLGHGTVGYNAPETIESKVLTDKADLFSLGIICYRIATGKHPFMDSDSDPVRVNAMIREFQPEPPHAVEKSLPSGLSRLIMTMLEKEPEKRPDDGYALCQALKDMGARYPFERMIRPKHLLALARDASGEIILNHPGLAFDEATIDTLRDMAGDDHLKLRNILEINFNRRTLCWEKGRLILPAGRGSIIWPRKLQLTNKTTFSLMPYSLKKKAVLCALVGSLKDAELLGIVSDPAEKAHVTRPILRYLKDALSKPTIKRFALILARKAHDNPGNDVLTARLYLKAGDLKTGYAVTSDAATRLINDNEYKEALDLLRAAERLCRAMMDMSRLKLVLLKIAQTLKKTGDSTQAERTYLDIIELCREHPPDKLLAETYKDLGDLYKMKQNYEDGINSLKQAEKIYLHLGDELELSHTINNMGNILSLKGQYDEAIGKYRRALKIQRRLKAEKDVAIILNNLAGIYFFRGRYQRTLKIYSLAIRLQRRVGNIGEIARTLNNLGCVHNELGDFGKAHEYLTESISLNRRIGSKKELLFNLDNLTNVMLSAGRLKESLGFLREGSDLSHELSDLPHTAVFLANMATVQKRMGFYGQALDNLKKAMEIHERINDNQHFLVCMIQLADLHLRINNIEQTSKITDRILSLSHETDDQKAYISALIMKGLLQQNTEDIHKAIATAQAIKADRMGLMGRLKLAYLFLRQNQPRACLETLEGLSNIFHEGRSDIENAGYFILKGCGLSAVDKTSDALACLQRAYRTATVSALLPETIDASFHIASVSAAMQEHETSYKYYRKAINGLKTIADDIKDETAKRSFLSDGKIASVMRHINELKSMFSQKKKAGC